MAGGQFKPECDRGFGNLAGDLCFQNDLSVGSVEVGAGKGGCVRKALHRNPVRFHEGKHFLFQGSRCYGQCCARHPCGNGTSAAFHVLAGGGEVFVGDGVDAVVGEDEVFACGCVGERDSCGAACGKSHVEKP